MNTREYTLPVGSILYRGEGPQNLPGRWRQGLAWFSSKEDVASLYTGHADNLNRLCAYEVITPARLLRYANHYQLYEYGMHGFGWNETAYDFCQIHPDVDGWLVDDVRHGWDIVGDEYMLCDPTRHLQPIGVNRCNPNVTTITPSELYIFDFDHTLLRSPWPPILYEGSWWDELISLTPPVVPDYPSPRWWIQPTVAAARRVLQQPNALVVLLTGRLDEVFHTRVEDLLQQIDLSFHAVHLSDGTMPTLKYKQTVLHDYLSAYRGIRVHFWDDLDEILNGLTHIARTNGSHVVAHKVEAAAMPAPPFITDLAPLPRANPLVFLGLP